MSSAATAARDFPYARLLRHPGVARLATAALVLGIAQTMVPVAFLLFARRATHSYASASLVLGAATAGTLLFGPARGRLLDRVGARTAVLALALPDLATDLLFLLVGRGQAPTPELVALGFLGGAVSAPAFAALRTTWSQTLAGTDLLDTGFALMAVLMETTYIAGPLVAGAAIAAGSPATAVAMSAALSTVGVLVFARGLPRDRGTVRGTVPAPPAGRLAALAGSGIRTLAATAVAFGLTFGVLDVAFPAAARTHGSAAAAGVLLSSFAAGAWLGSLLYGTRRHLPPPHVRYPRTCLLAAAGFAPLILLPRLGWLIALAVCSGALFAPASVSQLAVLEAVVSDDHRSEAYSWLSTAYLAGLSLGAALAGQLVSHVGIRAALAAAGAAALLAAAVSWARRETLRG